MNRLTVIADTDKSGVSFDAMLKHPLLLKDTDEPVTVIIKDKGTVNGNPIAMISFQIVQKDGSLAIAQTVTTVRLLKGTLKILETLYPDL